MFQRKYGGVSRNLDFEQFLVHDNFHTYLHLGNGMGHPRGLGKLTRTLTHEDRVLDLTG